MKSIEYFKNLLEDKTYKKYDNIYYSKCQIKNNNYYRPNQSNNKENNYNFKIGKKDIPEIKSYTSMITKSYQDKSLIESIFYPNKATNKQLSTKGTEIDIMALILYTLHPVQEPMIYLEEKGGMIRDYSISIIIDNSKTCFSSFNEKHSFLTIINLLKIMNTINVPSFDLIITGKTNENSHILIFDKPSLTIFKNDSIFEKLLILLSNPISNSDLSKSIQTVYDLKKMKKNDKDSYLFILTDGLCHKHNENKIIYYSKLCRNVGIKIFGIGLGIYPLKAKEFFETFIYSLNPELLLKAISIIFGKLIKTESELKLISEVPKEDKIKDIFLKIEKNNKYYFEELRKELKKIKLEEDDEEKKEIIRKEKIKKINKRHLKIRKENIVEFETKNENIELIEKMGKIKNISEEEIIKVKKNIQLLEDMNYFGYSMKEEILKEKKQHPEKFYTTEEIIEEKKKGNDDLYALGIFAKALESQGMLTVIEKQNKDDEDSRNTAETTLQFLVNGLSNKETYDLHFDFGKEKNDELLNNEKERIKLHNKIRKKISEVYNINEEEIIITNPRRGSYDITIILNIFQSKNFNESNKLNFDELIKKFQKEKDELNKLFEIKEGIVLGACKLTQKDLDIRGNNKDGGWAGKGEKRGGEDYHPPFGWIGYGLNVMNKYDNNKWLGMSNCKGEWCVAYHGVGDKQPSEKVSNITGLIIKGSFKIGTRHAEKNADNLRYNENTEEGRNKPKKCGKGVYCSPDINYASKYAGEIIFNNKIYKCALMLRIDPSKIRQSANYPKEYILEPNEMRPYRILLKEVIKKKEDKNN